MLTFHLENLEAPATKLHRILLEIQSSEAGQESFVSATAVLSPADLDQLENTIQTYKRLNLTKK